MRLQEYSANGLPVTAAMHSFAPSRRPDACEWLSLEHSALGAERVGWMVVRSAQVRKVLKTISRLSPYKATVSDSRRVGDRQGAVARALHSLGSRQAARWSSSIAGPWSRRWPNRNSSGTFAAPLPMRARIRSAISAQPTAAPCSWTNRPTPAPPAAQAVARGRDA